MTPALASARAFICEFKDAHDQKHTFMGRLAMKRLADNAEAEIAALDASAALQSAPLGHVGFIDLGKGVL